MNYRLEKKTLLLWRIRVGAAALAAALLFALLSVYTVYFYVPAAVFVLLGAVAVFWYLPAFFERFNMFVGENAVIVTKGVFIRTTHIMPYKRLVFAGGFSTPAARVMGLKGIMLRAARATVFIPEIEASAADRLIFDIGGEKYD